MSIQGGNFFYKIFPCGSYYKATWIKGSYQIANSVLMKKASSSTANATASSTDNKNSSTTNAATNIIITDTSKVTQAVTTTSPAIRYFTLTAEQVKKVTFNHKWYADMYSDVRAAYGYDEKKLYAHFLTYGIREGRCGNPLFDISYYGKLHKDLIQHYGAGNYSQMYFHFIHYGIFEGRPSSQYYHGTYYRAAYSKDLGHMDYYTLACHYLDFGIKEKRIAISRGKVPTSPKYDPNPIDYFQLSAEQIKNITFNARYYIEQNPDLLPFFGYDEEKLYNHYITSGIKEGRISHPLFNIKYYSSAFEDLNKVFGKNNYEKMYWHYINYGFQEGRPSSKEYYHGTYYKYAYSDLTHMSYLDLFNHYLQFGIKEKRIAIAGGKVPTMCLDPLPAPTPAPAPTPTPAPTTDKLIDVTAQFAGKTITLQSVENGKYMCADPNYSNTPVMCNRDNAASYETFTVSPITSDGWVGFKAGTNGNYLSAMIDTTDAPLRASYNWLQSWECFRIYQKQNDYYIKAQANGKWLCVRVDTAGAPVQAYANGASTWERFTIRVQDNNNNNNTSKTWQWPLSNTYVCGNDWSEYYSSKSGDHLGVDIKSSTGDKNIYAACSGVVTKAGWNSANGYCITIRHNLNGRTVYSFYGHLSKINVSVGQNVSRGNTIGVIGNSGGSSTGTHLHFAITTQNSLGTWGYGSAFNNGNNSISRHNYTFYNPHFVINNNRLP